MRKTFLIPGLVAAALSLQLARAGESSECAECPLSKTTNVSAAGATCSAAEASATGATCSAANTRHVMLKVKGDAAEWQKALAGLEGIAKLETCPTTKFTKVSFTGDKVCSEKILTALKEAGHKVEAQRVTYSVKGLACNACVSKVSTALSKVAGVADTQVCHESKTAVVDFDPNKTCANTVLAAIDAAGFKAEAVN